MLASSYMMRRRLYRRYAQHRPLQAPFHSRFDDDGFRTTSALFDDRRGWDDLLRWMEDGEYILLYEADDIFRVIPKRLLAGDGRIRRLRELLTSRLGAA